MGEYTELKRLVAQGSLPPIVATLIAENERLAANVKLNLCDHPAIHRGDVDLLISFISGTSQIELAELHQCTPPNISRKIRRVKERLGWKSGMGAEEIQARADQLRALASQGAVVTADLMEERDQLKAENEALLEGMARIMRETRMGDSAFTIACEVVGELCGAAMSKGEQS